MGLTCIDTANNNAITKIGIAHGLMPQSALAFCHVACFNRKSDVHDMLTLDASMFHAWRTTHCNPAETIVPWGHAMKFQANREE